MKKTFYSSICNALFLSLCTVMLLACNGKDGAPGPAGDQGPAGETGALGPRGNDGRPYIKDGSVSGTITGFRKDEVTPIDEDFTFEYSLRQEFENGDAYFSKVTETSTPGIYRFDFRRRDSLFNINSSSFQLVFEAPLDFSTISPKKAFLLYLRNLNDKEILRVQAILGVEKGNPSVPITFTDMAYNASNGLLTGKYTWYATDEYFDDGNSSYSSSTLSGQPLTITGQFSVKLKHISSFRLSAGQ